eukprot:GHVT01100202.1.p2 GENE.GHVT01100202.1~~GHVT01100202.1.p2  ORF type:complete len:119 (-),score=0.22 GHVT01100202.1:104-460(-)
MERSRDPSESGLGTLYAACTRAPCSPVQAREGLPDEIPCMKERRPRNKPFINPTIRAPLWTTSLNVTTQSDHSGLSFPDPHLSQGLDQPVPRVTSPRNLSFSSAPPLPLMVTSDSAYT